MMSPTDLRRLLTHYESKTPKEFHALLTKSLQDSEEEYVCSITWVKDDILAADNNLAPKMVYELAEYVRKPLVDLSIEAGWQILQELLTTYKYDKEVIR